jgi:hypothetical protein
LRLSVAALVSACSFPSLFCSLVYYIDHLVLHFCGDVLRSRSTTVWRGLGREAEEKRKKRRGRGGGEGRRRLEYGRGM